MPDNPSESQGPRVKFHYVKSNFFRVIHVDGAIGGLTGQGFIHCALYSERPAIPQVVEHEVLEDRFGAVLASEGKAGFVREIDVDLILSPQTATALRDWLTQQLDKMHEFQKMAEPPQ
jgi:hypothetical protein